MPDVVGPIVGLFGADKQAGATKDAANTAAEATMYGVDAMLKMWEKAQEDFKPYLEAGEQGLSTLTSSMPQYLNNVLTPLASQIASYQSSGVINPNYGSVNPVTGEIMQPTNTVIGAKQNPMQAIQSPSKYTTQAGSRPTTGGVTKSGTNYQTSGGTGRDSGPISGIVTGTGSSSTNTQAAPSPVKYPRAIPGEGNSLRLPTSQIGATSQQLIEGGVLAPTVPTLPGQIDFAWNPEDEVYQYKLKQAEDAQKKYLSAIGGTDSSAALTKMRDTGLAVAAEDIDKQYARQQTERNYLAQKAMDEYNANAARGNTLYSRQYQAGQDAYNKANTALATYDQDRLNNLMRAYDTYGNLYGLNYGSALDLSKIGAGQAGSAGQSSLVTGSNIANQYSNLGDTQANAIMANSQIWGNFMNGLANQSSQTANNLANYFMNSGNSTGYSSYVTNPYQYGGGSSWGNTGYSQPITGGGVGDIGAWG